MRSVMLHSLKANLVNLQDENKPTLHVDCYISTTPIVESVSYIPDAWTVACFSPRVLPEPAFIRQAYGPRFFNLAGYGTHCTHPCNQSCLSHHLVYDGAPFPASSPIQEFSLSAD